MIEPLDVTSPPIKGKEVTHAQKVLADVNNVSKFGNFKPGPIDSEYGPQTGGAAWRARFWLGFPKDKLYHSDGSHITVYNDKLNSFLLGKARLPYTYQLRRAARIKAAREVPLRLRAFKIAQKNIGVKESPAGSNNVLYARWYRRTDPANGWAWCAMFVTYCYVMGAKEGSMLVRLKAFVRGVRYAYTPFMVHDARAGMYGMMLLNRNQVKRGDIVMFDWGGAGQGSNPYLTDHTGLFDEWVDPRAGIFKTIEGNTAVGNESNGGEVMHRGAGNPPRQISMVSAFIRVEV